MRRARAYLICCGLIYWILEPAWRPTAPDSFPASSYPMFAYRPEDPWVFTVVGADSSGKEHRLSPSLITGSHEVMQAATTVQLAIFAGESAQSRLCRDVAERIAASELETLRQAKVIGQRFDPIRYFVDEQPFSTVRFDYAACDVPGPE